MNRIETYFHEIGQRLYANAAEAERFIDDLRAHFAEGRERGESDEALIAALGRPEDVAGAFNAERPTIHAGFWLRFLAFFADCGVLGLLCLPFVALILVIAALSGSDPSVAALALMCLIGLSVLGISMVYFPLLEARFGQTAGKRLLGLKVVTEDLGPISLGQAVVRRLSFFFEFLFVDALFVPFTENKQRALDIVSRTFVVREPGRPVSAAGIVMSFAAPMVACCCYLTLALVCGSFS